ncbi:hypothetical protein DL96DRAFT_1634698 [Flagelloscypha sp. PMI_526]|nr:hypothetical protein DL96DRAFT_1634698 [Flagelloscypha sp. PMI_526]
MRTVMKHCPNVTTMEVRDTLHRAMGWPPEQTSYEGISFPHLRHLSTDVSIWRTGATALPRSFSHSVYANLHTLFLSSPSLGSHAAVNNDAQYPLRLWDWSSLALLPHLRNLCITAESSNDEPHWSQAAKDIIVHRPPGLNNFVLLFPDERGSLPNSRHSGGEARKRLIRMMPDLVYGCVSTSPHPSPPVGLPGFVLWISIETLQNTWLDKLWDGAAHAKVAREEWPEKKSVAIETATQRLQKIVEKKAKRQTLRLEYAKREQELKGSKEPEVDERMKDIDPSSDLEESETIEEAIKELWDI